MTFPTSVYQVPGANGDGYDWMDHLHSNRFVNAKWTSLVSWGEDGWDMGSWPLVVISIANPSPDIWMICSYCEGDLSVKVYATAAAWYDALDAVARFHWQHKEWFDPTDSRFYGPYKGTRRRAHYDQIMKGHRRHNRTKGRS